MNHYSRKGRRIIAEYRFLFPIIMILAALFFGLLVMLLWNAIIPAVFGTNQITFWQAVGLLVLSRLLFGGFLRGPGRFGRPPFRKGPSWRARWMEMNDEERKKFVEEWKKRCDPDST